MSTGQIIRLALQALVFIAWAFLMFRTLMTLRARQADQGGPQIPTVGGFSGQLKYWLTSEEDKSERKTLFFLTFVLIAMNAMNILTAP
ncbi:hypothetical protein [Gymnodinialimonas sp.]